MVLSLIIMPLVNIVAYEAHIINVTANIVNDIPDIKPAGSQFCNIEGVDVVLTTTMPDSTIIYTLDNSDPTCPFDDPSEFIYTAPFHLTASTTVKARTCHGDKQSMIAVEIFDISYDYCHHTCGNGVLDVAEGEECDDGNLEPGDGCDATCHNETNASRSPNL